MKLDVLAFASHPDDAELCMGGTIAKMTSAGLKVGIVDLTKGEMGTRGTTETREKEAAEASKILNISVRDNLGLPDGQIKANFDYVKLVIQKIRKYRPTIIFAPYFNDRHPDHMGTSHIIKEAMFFSGLTKVETLEEDEIQERYRPHRLLYYMQTYEFDPSFIVDISDVYDTKMKALRAYGTQFFNPSKEINEPETFISKSNFMEFIESRAKSLGFKIGKHFGEAFYSEEKIELDIVNFVNSQ
jgi:bacillithiol biosynthesis deacetylase BshB1